MRYSISFLLALLLSVPQVIWARAQQNSNTAVGTAAAPSYTENTRVPLSTNLAGALRVTPSGTVTVAGSVDITAQVPGTGATNLGKAEDNAHASGDTGVAVLAVRDDTLDIRSGAENDYEPLHTDVLGQLWIRQLDPCSGVAKSYYPVDIVTAATTEIANAVASNYFYICSVNLFSAGTNNVVIVEDDSDACASPTAGLMGGVTAAEGYNLTAQTGIAMGNGNGSVMRTAAVNRYLCIITSAAVQLSGTVVYATAP